MAVGAGACGVAGVVGVQEVDAADDPQDPLDRSGELLARRVRVAGVEAEPERELGLRVRDRLPQAREGIEAARHRVIATRRVLEIQRHRGLEYLERPGPAADPGLDPVLGVARMDDHRRGVDLRRRVAGLLEDLARPVADVVPRRADVYEVRGVHVEGQCRLPKLGGVAPLRRLLPALRIGEEDLHAVGAERLRLRQRLGRGHVGADGGFRGGHAGEDSLALGPPNRRPYTASG